MYHDGMRELQDRYGGRKVADALEKHRKHFEFTEDDRAFIEALPFFFLATSWDSSVDCSIKSGHPGFIRVAGINQVEWPDYDGNRMYRSLGNIIRNPNVGMLFVKFDGESTRIRLTGKAEIIDDPTQFADVPGAKCLIRVTADYIYYNCPRSVPKMELIEHSPYLPREGYKPPQPEWKKRDYIRDIIDED
jgi:predicted pyridoxine 5'-phosphate oxidase superfamily flavin-nucleotide-binding protein